jgi:peptidoglycan/xylan/chitin deacetylase (PgdA/CDA1 family)
MMAQALNDALIQGNNTTTAPGMPLVLMYHSVEPYQADPYLVTVSPPRFGQQMGWLARRGLRGVSMRELLSARAAGAGRGLVGLTFDDGYADFSRHALPVLRRYGFGATVFVIAGRLGGDNAWDPEGPRKRLMDAGEVRDLAQAGIEIGSHGLRHVRLPAARDSLAEEVGGSRRILQEITGDPVGGFCYPYGDLDADTVTRVRDMGYDYGCAIWPSAYTSRLALPRTYIGEADTAPRLWAKTARHRLTRQNRLGPVLGRPARAA